ncbi:MAG: hypothetical protein RSB70_05320 [Clostridium sp.]
MNRNSDIKKMVTAALLCAIGIVIPMFSPVKIILEPASFTLASHVSIFIAMFISPSTALFVAIGSAVGFLLGGFPIVIVLRALSHVFFAGFGALYLKKHRETLNSWGSATIFSLVIGIIHGVCEVLTVIPFYFGSSLTTAYYSNGFLKSVIILVGLGTIVHSMIDFVIAKYVWDAIPNSLVDKHNNTKVIS